MEYEKCLVQVYEVLNQLEEAEMEKIPEEVIKNIEEKMDKNYNWEYDENKNLEEQEIDRKTIAILSYINMEYLLNEEEKDLLRQMHDFNEIKLFPKVETVNFASKNANEYTEEKTVQESTNALVEVTKYNWYNKVWDFLKRIFNK